MTFTWKQRPRRHAAGDRGGVKWAAAALAGLSATGFAMQHPPAAPQQSDAAVAPPGDVLLFDAASTEVSAVYRGALRRQVRYLRGHPELAVIVEGYTHERGPVADDLKLGLERTLAVSRVLEKAGIERDRIQLVSYEESAAGAAARRVALRYIPAASAGALDVAQLGVTSPLLGIPVQ